LPQGVIEAMLRRCGVEGDLRLYVSSEIGLRKDTGELYEHILSCEGLAPEQVLVVGDNERSDFQIPADRGMLTLHMLRAVELARAQPRLAALVEKVEREDSVDADVTAGLLVRRAFAP